MLAALALAMTVGLTGCLSFHVHKDVHKDAEPTTVVVPEPAPNP